MIRQSERLGILRELPDGKIEVISPRLHRAGLALIELGVTPEAGIAIVAKLRRHAEGAARVYIDLFGKEIWEPFDKAGQPEEEWPKVREALDRMRPLASDALLAVFQITMGESTEKAGERTLQEAAKPAKSRAAVQAPALTPWPLSRARSSSAPFPIRRRRRRPRCGRGSHHCRRPGRSTARSAGRMPAVAGGSPCSASFSL